MCAKIKSAERPQPQVGASRGWLILALIAAGVLAYSTSFRGAWVMDDEVSVLENFSIRSLGSAWSPPADSTLGGRPLANLSFAANYAAGGESPVGYHAVNLGIHLAAGLILFGVVRRTLARTGLLVRRGGVALDTGIVAAFAAGLWLVHPLTTETVTYISQRTEALMALFYLLTLYAFIRGTEGSSRAWLVASVASCAVGMACKEIIVTAPVVVAVYDRIFFAGSWREVWVRRRAYYLSLAATWLWLAWLMSGLAQRSVGFGQGVSSWTYALTECQAVITYLHLAIFPFPLVFDYGPVFLTTGLAIPYAGLLLVLLVAVGWLLRARPAVGFAAAVFFVVLAPTSSVIPIALQPIAENRAYLSAAAVVTLLVIGAHWWLGRRCWWLLGALGLGAMTATVIRTRTYQDHLTLWTDTVAKRPHNPRAHNNLAKTLLLLGRTDEAIAHFREAIRLNPGEREARVNLIFALIGRKQLAEAEAELSQALPLMPHYAPILVAQGGLLRQQHRLPEAEVAYRRALELRPGALSAQVGYAEVLVELRRPAEALALMDAALAVRPGQTDARVARGTALLGLGRSAEGIGEYERALREPGVSSGLRGALARALDDAGRTGEAQRMFEEALRLRPNDASTHVNYGRLLYRLEQLDAAEAHAREALRLDPSLAAAHGNLAGIYIDRGRLAEALAEAEEALRVDPTYVEARYNLGAALIRLGRPAEAVGHLEKLMQAAPDNQRALANLAAAYYQVARYNEAEAAYVALLRLDPANVDIKQSYASTLYQNGRREDAVGIYREILQQSPGMIQVRRNLGLVLNLMGRKKEAQAEFEAVLRAIPDDPTGLEYLRQMRGN